MARVQFEPGAVLRVPLEECWHTYARMLEESPFLAFYDLRTTQTDPDLPVILDAPVLFVLGTEWEGALRIGRWPIVGSVPVTDHSVTIPLQFMQSVGDGRRLSVIDHRGNRRPATLEECEGLERAAVWDWSHVEERLADHYAGRPNAHLQVMQLKRP
jgi:Immunity protein 26